MFASKGEAGIASGGRHPTQSYDKYGRRPSLFRKYSFFPTSSYAKIRTRRYIETQADRTLRKYGSRVPDLEIRTFRLFIRPEYGRSTDNRM